MKASTFFIGLATGTVVAAITVFYSTPQSGSELRTSAKSTSTDMKEIFLDLKEKTSELIGSISILTKEARETIPGAVEGIRKSITKWQQATEPNKNRMETELSAIQKAIENLEKTISAQQK